MKVRLYRLGVHSDENSIEPSCGVMDIFTRGDGEEPDRVVTDCGFLPRNSDFDKDGDDTIIPDLSLFRDGVPIKRVRITHAHGDHVLATPLLAPYLAPDVKIVMTRPTAAVYEKILWESLGLNVNRGKIPPYGPAEIAEVTDPRRMIVVEHPGEIELLLGMRDFVDPEAHIPGACSYTTIINGVPFHTSGDRCSHDQPGIAGAELLPRDRWPRVIMGSDCTYGADPDSDTRTWQGEMDRGYDLCAEAVKGGHPALWYAFRMHRSGAIAHEMQRRGLTDLAPVFLDGGGREYTRFMLTVESRWCGLDRQIDVGEVRMIASAKERQRILQDVRTYAAIATPGMGGPGGVGMHWRRVVLPDPYAVVIFTGYVAPGTDGFKILQAYRRYEKTGQIQHVTFLVDDEDGNLVEETIPMRCRVVQIRTGSHDSRGKILRWFGSYASDVEVAVTSHGSVAALESIAAELKSGVLASNAEVYTAPEVTWPNYIELDV